MKLAIFLIWLVCQVFSIYGCASAVQNKAVGDANATQPVTQGRQVQARDIRVQKDVCYLDPNRQEKCDIYMPAEANESSTFPAIVLIHGGGWRAGDKASKNDRSIAMNLARGGYVCMSINYLLSEPDKPAWPEALYDCKRAVQFLRKNAERFHLDPNHIGVIGGSAGGHLSAMVALTGPEAGLEPPGPYKGVSSRVQAAVPMFGVHDFNSKFARSKRMNEFVKDLVEGFIGASRVDKPGVWLKASPVNHISKDDPPFLIIHGGVDILVAVEQSKQLHKKLKEKSVVSELLIVGGAGHGFGLDVRRGKVGHRDLRPQVFGFLDRHLKSKAGGEK